MSKKFKITEEQYKIALSEGINLTADVNAAGGDVNAAVQKTKEQAKKDGVKLDNATISIPANESRLVSKKELVANRIKVLKESSDIYTVKNFMSVLKK